MGELYQRRWELTRAEPLLQRALAIREAALGPQHPGIVQALNALAFLSMSRGSYGQAEALYQRALSIQEAAFGDTHPHVAQALSALAFLYQEQGLYGRAEPLYQRALALQEAALGEHHPDVAQTLGTFASLYLYQGLYDRAESLLQRALTLQEAALGEHRPDVARVLSALAFLYTQQGLYGRAEPLLQRAFALQEAALGHDHPLLASSLIKLARLHADQGLYDRAEPLLHRALALQEAALGPQHPDVASSLHSLARIYQAQGLYGRAEPLFQRALDMMESAHGKGYPDVAIPLNSLARLYVDQGLYDRAEPLLQRALALQEAFPSHNYPDIALTLGALAELYLEQGAYSRAEPLFQRALAILEEAHGGNHPWVAQTLHHLARIRLARHRLAEALPLFTRSFAISEQRLRQEALGFSESRLSSFLLFLRTDEQALYALLRAHPGDTRVRRLALAAVLLRKGRSVEETASISRTLYRNLGAEDRDTFERLRSLRTRQATLSLAGPGSPTPAKHPQRLETLATEGDALEADLARRSAPLRALTALPSPAEVVDRVAAALPQDGALVELIAYQDSPLVPQPGTSRVKRPGQLRYLALVLFPEASTHVVDLGPAAPIDLAATRLREALARRDARVQSSAHALYRLAFQPLLPVLGKTRRLLLSPDGQLGLVSFAALHDGRRFLLDSFDISYVTSGRELLPRPQETLPSSSVFVLADPDFAASPRTAPSPSGSLGPFFSTPRAKLAMGSWVPLPGTRQEAEGIQHLLPQARLFLGAEATKERLLSLPTPGILHLATHGFFLGDGPLPTPGSRAVGHFGALGDNPQAPGPQEPLLRSGLALAGAGAPVPDASTPSGHPPEAALVTALELAGLDLWGTQLVVLSACDTGRGAVQPGQGVHGLRRALVVAGAETVVMSLWTVDDDSTRLLMERYYRNLLAGQGRAAALHEAMRALRKSRPHPHDWAPFIALGSAAPLRAITPTPPRTPEQ
ncbi:kinesin light chain-like protein [Archangium gephyra]|uniref:Kinesin light chain-like protein n=1 Tax=Archangium gephyra TaxID=48 RepID=A0AAC8Q5P4_9BACT|nr:kinesin light chain-like protein [Archangium gephyra]